jgi:hypothetical protein
LLVVPVGYSYLAELQSAPWRKRAARAIEGTPGISTTDGD